MTKPTLIKQMKSCIKMKIPIFEGIDGEHNLLCPTCNNFGDVQKEGHLLCPNDNCRVGRFFTV